MKMLRAGLAVMACIAAAWLAGCAGPAPYVYRYVPGKTAVLEGVVAEAPPGAPWAVRKAVMAANEIAGRPYLRGGGHGSGEAAGYDCSGAVSHVLVAAGQAPSAAPSGAFRSYGRRGRGEWITVYARRGHVFMVIAGLRFESGWGRQTQGPRWSTESRTTRGFSVRHPSGL